MSKVTRVAYVSSHLCHSGNRTGLGVKTKLTKLYNVVSVCRVLHSFTVAKCVHEESGLDREFNEGQPSY